MPGGSMRAACDAAVFSSMVAQSPAAKIVPSEP
jgi:hypothetical protein